VAAERGAAEILRAARERITPKGRWTTDAYARRAGDEAADPLGKCAVRWCAIGALVREEGVAGLWVERPGNVGADFLRDAAREIFGLSSPTTVNDEIGHDAVLQMYDRAIELAEAAS
jgi:hypothetical protein